MTAYVDRWIVALALLLMVACAPKRPPLVFTGSTAQEFLAVVRDDFGKDGVCSIDARKANGWVMVICQRRDGTVRQYDTWLR